MRGAGNVKTATARSARAREAAWTHAAPGRRAARVAAAVTTRSARTTGASGRHDERPLARDEKEEDVAEETEARRAGGKRVRRSQARSDGRSEEVDEATGRRPP